jgi:membrane protein
VSEPAAHALGRDAEAPLDMPWPGWKAVLRRTWYQMISDRVSLAAAGCAFYATLALFPAISMLLSLYGLVFDPMTVEPHLEVLRGLLPSPAFSLIAERVHLLVTKPSSSLGISLLISAGVTVWSTTTGTKSLIAAINLAYEERENRSIIRYQVTAFGLTLLAVVGAVLGLAALVGLPAMLEILGAATNQKLILQAISLALTLVFVVLALSLIYRYGPCRNTAKWRWVTPGSVLATLLWVAASVLFSFYVSDIATYATTYGSLGAIVGLMMWFFVSAYVVLLGAELNAELELQTARDSTEGPPKPMGSRGAYVADRIAED